MHAIPQSFNTVTPWYAQRWPWLLMLGPALVIAAGSYTSYLAVTHEDALVVGDYYKKGKAINQELRRDRAASAMRLGFEGAYDPATGTLSGDLRSFGQAYPTPFRLTLAHATLPGKDMVREVRPDAAGRFTVQLGALAHARWQVQAEAPQWRLATAWFGSGALTMVADPVRAP